MKKSNILLSAFLLFLFSFLFCLPFSAEGKLIEAPLNGVNVTRLENFLVLYRNKETTETNEWGYEVVCDANGEVLEVGGNDNVIPEGGFVLSGHGEMISFLKDNIDIGDFIVFLEAENMIVITEDGQYSPFYEKTYSYDGVNTTRMTDQIILFQNKAKTGSNPYGYEIVCDPDGFVISLGDNDNAIPKNGFVLSGHGAGADILRSVKLASSVTLDVKEKTFTVSYQPENLKKASEIAMESMRSDLEEAKKEYRDVLYDKMEETLTEAEKLISEFDEVFASGDTIAYRAKIEELGDVLDSFHLYNTESPAVETRGLWIRPTETTLEQVEKTVADVKNANLNTIYLETYFGGYTICYTRPDDILMQNPAFQGFDVLQAYIDVCHREGISLQLWNTCFNAGNIGKDGTLANRKPEWLAVSKSGGNAVQTSEGTMYFINPANREAKDYLLDFYSYVLSTYDIDGIQLDYIRYGEGEEPDGYGYNEDACDEFEKYYGVDPHEIARGGDHWNDWCAFRAEYVTDFLLEVKALVKEKRPDILFSADLYSELDNGPTSVMQNSPLWLKEGYLDAAFPMSYGDSGVYEHALKANAYGQDHCYDFIGTAIYQGYSVGTVISLVEDTRRANADGFTWFEYTHLYPDGYAAAAIDTVLRNPAIAQADGLPAFRAQLDAISDWLDRILVPFGGMTTEAAEELKTKLADLKELAGDDLYSNREALASALRGLTYETLDENAAAALQNDILRTLRMVNLAKPAFQAEFQPKPEQGQKKQEENDPEQEHTGPIVGMPCDISEQETGLSPEAKLGLGIGIGAAVAAGAGLVIGLLAKKKKGDKK